MKKKFTILVLSIMFGLTACGNKVETTFFSIATDSKEKVAVSEDARESEFASREEKKNIQVGDTTDQIFFINGLTFTSSDPFVYAGDNSNSNTDMTYWTKNDTPYAEFGTMILKDEDYERISKSCQSTARPEGMYYIYGNTFNFYTQNNKGENLRIYAATSLEIMNDNDYYDKIAQTGEVFLQLVEDLVKSGNASANETSGVTIVRQEGQQPVLSVYVHD